MKKFVSFPTLARKLSVFLAVLLAVAAIAPAALAVPKRPENQYVLDSADVLSSGTEQHIIKKNQELFDQYGAEIVVAAVDFLGGEDIEDYTYKMFKDWGVGSVERNNGILLVLAIGEEDYYAQAGYGIDDYFDGGVLGDILYDYLEDDFAAEDYDAGVRKVFDALADEVEGYYAGGAQADIQPEGWDDDYEDYDDYDPLFSRWSIGHFVSMILSFIFKVIVILLVVWVFVGFFSSWGGGGRGSGGGGGGGFWRGMMLGSMMNRRRNYWGGPYGPPPPPPGPGPGPRPGSRPGGFGSPPRGGFGGGGHSGGFHGGGGSHGGGAGRSGGFGGGGHSGGGFHGGGGSHGGGAGRR